jgi:hypothetical protein
MCRKSNDQRSRVYCSRQQLWLAWQFETTEWYNPERMCTSLIIQHQFAYTSLSFYKPLYCVSNEWSCGMFEKLPGVDKKYCPQVTFRGPRDEWMKKAGKYKYLYKMDTEIAYKLLQVWVDANHPSFQTCITDMSDNVRDEMNQVTGKIIEEAITTTDPDIIGISSMLDAEDEENSEVSVTLIMKLHLHTQVILLYYQTHPSLMQMPIQQSQLCWI